MDPTHYDSVAELLDALTPRSDGLHWIGLRSAPVDGHPEITVEAGTHVTIYIPVDAQSSRVEVGPVVRAYAGDRYEHLVTINRPDDLGQAIQDAVARVAAAQDKARPGALGELHAAATAVREAEQQLHEARAGRDLVVRRALAEGVSVADIVARSSLSRERVYQIRDGRR